MTTGGGVASEEEASEAEAATAALKPAESSMGDSSPSLMDKRSPKRPPPPAATVTTRDREEALASCASVARAALDRICSCAKRRGRPACHCPTRDDSAFDRSVGRTMTNNKTKIERATKAATVRIFSIPSSTRSFSLRYILPAKRENRAGICLFRVFGKDPRRSQDRIVSATSCAFFFLYFLQIHLESPRSFLDFFGSEKSGKEMPEVFCKSLSLSSTTFCYVLLASKEANSACLVLCLRKKSTMRQRRKRSHAAGMRRCAFCTLFTLVSVLQTVVLSRSAFSVAAAVAARESPYQRGGIRLTLRRDATSTNQRRR